MVLGILGARSRHVEFFSQALRELYPQGDCRITHLWGQDAPERIEECLSKTDITSVCCTPEEVMDACDGVIIALRDGTQHAALAEACLKKRKPVFIDKPFTCSVPDAERILDCAERCSSSFTGGSTVCFTSSVSSLTSEMPECEQYFLTYQADPFSPFGGWYFYGSHLTDVCAYLFGGDFYRVGAKLCGGSVTALVNYPGFTVTIKSTPEAQPFIFTADREYHLDDKSCYKAGMSYFTGLVNGNTPNSGRRLLASVRMMDAVIHSLRSGGPIELK